MASILVLVIRGPLAAGAGVDSTVAEIELAEFSISGDLAIPEGEATLRVTNTGTVAHNLTLVGGPATPDLNAGESATLNLGDLAAGEYQLICAIPGHESSGMTATLTVGEVSVTDPHAGHATTDYAAMDLAMTESILDFPGRDRGHRQPAAGAGDPGRRDQAIRHHHRHHAMGGRGGQARRGLDLQRTGPRPGHSGR